MAWIRCMTAQGGGGGGTEVEYLMDNLIPNTYIKDNSPGGEISYSGWSATPYIPVTAGETIKMALFDAAKYAAWYSGTGGTAAEYIGNFNPSIRGYNEVVVPAGATYFRYSNSDSVMQQTMIWRDL